MKQFASRLLLQLQLNIKKKKYWIFSVVTQAAMQIIDLNAIINMNNHNKGKQTENCTRSALISLVHSENVHYHPGTVMYYKAY